MTTAWRQRPVEERHALNPALISQIVLEGAVGHQLEAGSGLPYPLAFPLVAAVLHAETRAALPRTLRTSLPAWVSQHPLLQQELAPRTAAMAPLVREGLLLGLRARAFQLQGTAITVPAPARSVPRPNRSELHDLLRSARKIGRWFAMVDSPPTVLALCGIRV